MNGLLRAHVRPENTIDEIIENAGMSSRPSYYSGRGATTSDLNPQILGRIHEGITTKIGTEAATAFIRMVASIQVLSATAFLIELHALAARDWKANEQAEGEKRETHIAIDDEGSAFATLAETLSRRKTRDGRGSAMDQTASIRGPFLREVGASDLIPQMEQGFGYGYR